MRDKGKKDAPENGQFLAAGCRSRRLCTMFFSTVWETSI